MSCSTDDIPDQPKQQLMESYYISYMHYPFGILPINTIAYIEYNSNNKIIKRKGGILEIDPASGYTYSFSDEIFDELSYQTNKIIIERKTSSTEYQMSKFKRFFSLNNEGKIVQKITETEDYKDTINFNYNPAGQLISSKLEKKHYPTESFYYYNAQKNLDSIITKTSFLSSTGISLIEKTVEIFKDYDNASNPTNNMMFFEELFYRSLSKNNYSTYSKIEYDINNKRTGAYESHWYFIYDEDGNIRFDRNK
ncbi:MAG: hypothetical protein WC389_07580 [Lutibacter sp.]|jgi:hypothetical protein